MDKKYNVLWIHMDELRADALGCYGNELVKTPNIDSIARQGVLFNNHHVQSPICVPSRVCEITGLYPHQTGIMENYVHKDGKWPEGVTTLPQVFAENGYQTVNLGTYHSLKDKQDEIWQENDVFYNFSDVANAWYFNDEEYSEEEHEVIYRGEECENVNVILSGKYPELKRGTPQTHLTDKAVEWLQSEKEDQPFFLRVAYLAPHTPVLAPEPYYSMYHPEDIDWDQPDESVLTDRLEYEFIDKTKKAYCQQSAENLKRMRATYYGLVSHLDQQIGRIIEAMKETGEYVNTIIYIDSDHGDLMGEYGQFQKGVFYDIVTRVPMIIAGPEVDKGRIYDKLSEQIDTAPTIMELCNLKKPAQFQGKNMLTEDYKKDFAIGEICLDKNGKIRHRVWIRTERWSMDWSLKVNGETTETMAEKDGKLIDMKNDSLAHNNLYYDPDYKEVVEELTAKFEEKTSDRQPIRLGSRGVMPYF